MEEVLSDPFASDLDVFSGNPFQQKTMFGSYDGTETLRRCNSNGSVPRPSLLTLSPGAKPKNMKGKTIQLPKIRNRKQRVL
jgi:hypothetical protein